MIYIKKNNLMKLGLMSLKIKMVVE